MNSGQRYRYDTRDYDDQRNYDREKDFYNYRDIEYGRDNRDRFQDRPRPGMRSNRDIPQYRDQDFENQDFQDEKPSKTGFIPPPPPPPPPFNIPAHPHFLPINRFESSSSTESW